MCRSSAIASFVTGWTVLSTAGVLSSGVLIELLAFPLAALSLVLFALAWRHFGARKLGPAFLYWTGIFMTIWGALHFGHQAWMLNAIATSFRPARYLSHPPVEAEIAVAFIPSAFVCLGLKATKNVTKAELVLACILLLSINPTILLISTWLRLPLSF